MAKITNKVLIAKLNKIAKDASARVSAGFFDHGYRYPETGESIPDVAAFNEFGGSTGQGYSPPRPFMAQAAMRDKQYWASIVRDTLRETGFDGRDVLDAVGYEMRKSIISSINLLQDPPNSKYTVEKKGSAKPLVDSGTMRESVEYKVRK